MFADFILEDDYDSVTMVDYVYGACKHFINYILSFFLVVDERVFPDLEDMEGEVIFPLTLLDSNYSPSPVSE